MSARAKITPPFEMVRVMLSLRAPSAFSNARDPTSSVVPSFASSTALNFATALRPRRSATGHIWTLTTGSKHT